MCVGKDTWGQDSHSSSSAMKHINVYKFSIKPDLYLLACDESLPIIKVTVPTQVRACTASSLKHTSTLVPIFLLGFSPFVCFHVVLGHIKQRAISILQAEIETIL